MENNINFKELYDELGARSLITHSFSLTGDAYNLLCQKIKDEVDLIYIQSDVTNLPFVEFTIDGPTLLIFDTKADADMKQQELTLVGHSVSLKPFGTLLSLSSNEEPMRLDIFTELWYLGIRLLRINDMLTFPLDHVTAMPTVYGFVNVDTELTNPNLYASYIRYKQIQEINPNPANEFTAFINELVNCHVSGLINVMTDTKGRALVKEDFLIVTAIVPDDFGNTCESVVLFPSKFTSDLCLKNENFGFLEGHYTKGMYAVDPFLDFLDLVGTELGVCIYFSPHMKFLILPDEVQRLWELLGK